MRGAKMRAKIGRKPVALPGGYLQPEGFCFGKTGFHADLIAPPGVMLLSSALVEGYWMRPW